MDLSYWIGFAATLVAVSLIPGPSTLVVFSHGATHGWLRSLITAGGNATATICQAIAASAGLGLVLSSSATVFMILKYAGALYLVYMGVQMWRSASRGVRLDTSGAGTPRRARSFFTSGFTVAASNPKAIAFFTALFPQFLSPAGNGMGQLAAMTAIAGGGAFAVAAFYGCLGATLRGLNLSQRVMARITRGTGGLMVASGLSLAASRA